MTKAQKRKIIYGAAETIHMGRKIYSCDAIRQVEDYKNLNITKEYCKFFGFRRSFWPFTVEGKERKAQRVIMLLLFAEAGI